MSIASRTGILAAALAIAAPASPPASVLTTTAPPDFRREKRRGSRPGRGHIVEHSEARVAAAQAKRERKNAKRLRDARAAEARPR